MCNFSVLFFTLQYRMAILEEDINLCSLGIDSLFFFFFPKKKCHVDPVFAIVMAKCCFGVTCSRSEELQWCLAKLKSNSWVACSLFSFSSVMSLVIYTSHLKQNSNAGLESRPYRGLLSGAYVLQSATAPFFSWGDGHNTKECFEAFFFQRVLWFLNSK